MSVEISVAFQGIYNFYQSMIQSQWKFYKEIEAQ